MAASYYGVPRTTVDVDFVVVVADTQLDGFLDELNRFGLEVDKDRIMRQLRAGYNVVSLEERRSPFRADFIIQPMREVERRPGSILGLRTFYQSPEQLILAKLRMVKATLPVDRSFKDREDVRQILANTRVDRRRIWRLARTESTGEILRKILLPPKKSRKRRLSSQ